MSDTTLAKEKLAADFRAVMDDIDSLMTATGSQAEGDAKALRARIRERERESIGAIPNSQVGERLARIESAVDSIAIEVERISEAQRFTTRLLAERSAASSQPASGPERTP